MAPDDITGPSDGALGTGYLTSLYLHNALATSSYRVDGHTISLSDIRQPVFLVGTQRDHMEPDKWITNTPPKRGLLVARMAPVAGRDSRHNGGIASG